MKEQTVSRALAGAALVLMAVVVVLGLIVTGPDAILGEVVRVLYIHPAIAWVAYLAFGVTSLCSLLWLLPRTRHNRWDQLASSSAEIGVVFTFLTLLTGSFWGRGSWGVWWTFDSRTTSTAMLLFLYLGVLALRSVPADFDTRARRSAVAALLAFVNVPIVHFSVRWWRTLHQQASIARPDPTVEGLQYWTMLLGVLAFTALHAWLLLQRYRIARWEDQLGDADLAVAIAARRSEAVRPTSTAGVAR